MTEEVIVVEKESGIDLVIHHTESGSAAGIEFSFDTWRQLRDHFLSGNCPNCNGDQIVEFVGRNKRHCQECGEAWKV